MSHNSFGHIFKFTTWGESHGKAIGCVVDGAPPMIELSEKDIYNFKNHISFGIKDESIFNNFRQNLFNMFLVLKRLILIGTFFLSFMLVLLVFFFKFKKNDKKISKT